MVNFKLRKNIVPGEHNVLINLHVSVPISYTEPNILLDGSGYDIEIDHAMREILTLKRRIVLYGLKIHAVY